MSVPANKEFQRIVALPSREWQPEHYQQAVDYWSAKFRRVPEAELWPLQAQALSECSHLQAGVYGLPVGEGKTLITALLPLVVGAVRPVLLTEPGLRAKTEHDYAELRKQWHIHPNIKIVSYSEMSGTDNFNLLESLGSDFIMSDEAQAFKFAPGKKLSGRMLRGMRFFAANRTRFVALSGSLSGGSVFDLWPLLVWSLREGAPIPLDVATASLWSEALDAKLPQGVWRRAPGALLQLGGEGRDELAQARNGFYRRLRSTPGVILAKPTELDHKLKIIERELPVPKSVTDAIEQLVETWETPNGEAIENGMELWRHGREMSCGFFQRWTPPAPENWLNARRRYAKFIRMMTGTETWVDGVKIPMDLPSQICASFPDDEAIVQWREIEKSFVPNPVGYWIDKFMIEDAKKWLSEVGVGLLWAEHIEVGQQVAAELGIPYFGGGDEAHAALLHYRGPCVLSIEAHHAGKNLQWANKMLVLSNPTLSRVWEQMIGRIDRRGQLNDCEVHVYAHTIAARQALQVAYEKSFAADGQIGSGSRLLKAELHFKNFDTSDFVM